MRLSPVPARRRAHPSLAVGMLVAVLSVVAETAFAALLRGAAPAHTLNAVYLPGIVLVAYVWGIGPGLGTALAGAVAFNLLVAVPAGSLRLATGDFVATLAIFLVVAVLTGMVAG